MEGTSSGGDRSIHALCDDALMQILVRLPSKSVLRCCAVCRNRRRITTDRCFLAARRQREMIMQSFGGVWDVETVPLDVTESPRKDSRHFLCPAQVPGTLCYSLDGLLVLKQQRRGLFVACNPTTTQWINLPELVEQAYITVSVCGFYDTSWNLQVGPRYYHVLSTGAILPRHADWDKPLLPAVDMKTTGLLPAVDMKTTRIPWLIVESCIGLCTLAQADLTGKMLPFDTDVPAHITPAGGQGYIP